MKDEVEPLWATGPGEILRHGIALLASDTDTKRRLAMISIDNAVELMMKTYIGLPRRITGLNITRKERDEICSTFPSLLDGIETHAADRINGINLGEIEWFHRLRNELYHQGNGLTVERQKVQVYAELAKILFASLFGVDLQISETTDMKNLGEFIAAWIEVEKKLADNSQDSRARAPIQAFRELHRKGMLSDLEFDKFEEARRTRNEVIHGKSNANVITRRMISDVTEIAKFLAA